MKILNQLLSLLCIRMLSSEQQIKPLTQYMHTVLATIQKTWTSTIVHQD